MNDDMRSLTDAGNLVRHLEQQLSEAVKRRDELVRAVVGAGEKKTVAAKAAGISHQRIHQLVSAA